MDSKPTGLFAKLLKLQKSVKGLDKDSSGSNYKYVSGSKLLGVLRPQMDELGLLLKQEVVAISNERIDYEVGKDRRPKTEILTTLRIQFTWIDVDTGETDVSEFAANGQNDFDKGVGSALTYSERYFLLKFFHIATDEDDCDFLDGLRHDKETTEKELAEVQYKSLMDRLRVLTNDADIVSLYNQECPKLPQDKWQDFYDAVLARRTEIKNLRS
uniref:ERF family protein n=1 Tax=Alistipes sp. TaxID=1872444 RepID=UPI004056F593